MISAGSWPWASKFSVFVQLDQRHHGGADTTVTYYTNDWFALEGNVVTGFAPTIYDRST